MWIVSICAAALLLGAIKKCQPPRDIVRNVKRRHFE